MEIKKDINVLALAYLGDAVYEIYIRKYLLSQNIVKVKNLQHESINYVSANAQAKFLKQMLDNNFLTSDELDIVYRARNHKSRSSKSTDIVTYHHSTALEALIGSLELNNEEPRIKEIMDFILTNNSYSKKEI